MRLVEFANDIDNYDDVIEDEADARGDADLITTLEFLRAQSAGRHLVPRVRVDSLINMINMHNDESAFNNSALMNAFKTNDVVKNLIADIKDDESTGIKYVYLKPIADSTDELEGNDGDKDAVKSEPEKIVSKMADKAISNRS
jgi:hypothetical protein